MTNGRILVIGSGAGVGGSVAWGLAESGFGAILLTTRPAPRSHPRLTIIRPPAAASLGDVDTVVHCGRTRTGAADPAALAATSEPVLRDAAAAGARRLVVLERPRPLRSLAGDDDGGLVEAMAAVARAASLDVARLRIAPVVGRDAGDALLGALARLVTTLDPQAPLQVLHEDDLARAVAAVCASGEDAAAASAGVVPAASLARALGVAPRRGGTGVARVDVGRARPLGWTPSWTAGDALDDLAMGTLGTVVSVEAVRRRRGRMRFRNDLPPADAAPADRRPLVHAAADGLRGELDTPYDTRFPTYSSVNLSEALPGPATPLSLTTVGRGTAAAGTAFIDLVPVGGVLEAEAWSRAQGVRGHRVYVNLSYACGLADIAPGMDVDAVAEQFVGRSAGTVRLFGDEQVPAPGRRARAALAVEAGRRMTGLLRSHREESERYVDEVRRLSSDARDAATLDGARLADATRLARDLVVVGWVLGGRNVLAVQLLTQAAEKLSPGSVLTVSGGAPLASAAPLLGVRALADVAREEPRVAALLRSGAPAPAVRDASPRWASVFDDALARFGHRGPGECELENPTFRDRPELLLRATAAVLAQESREAVVRVAAPRTPRAAAAAALARRAARAQSVREHARDHLVRATDALRRLTIEHGTRLVAAGVIDAAADVFYLRFDELAAPPPDARAAVARRRGERARLAALRIPPIIEGTWSADTPRGALDAGDQLDGAGASPGRAVGRVRIVDLERIDDLEPGEVLVANVTDVGYTPAFAYAAAVVTDVGGLMSHAAVVAREFGIPAVVDTANATSLLADGMLVEVDGATGTVKVVEA